MVDRMKNPMVFGGFGFGCISDEKIIEYLEREVGKIKRYRSKWVWMHIEEDDVSFEIKRGTVRATDTEPLSKLSAADVHFESAEARCRALRESEAQRLRIDNCILEMSPGIRNHMHADFERKEFPLTFDVEAVKLVWRESNNPSINFVIDPHLWTMSIRFIRDASVPAYFKERKRKVVIKCEVKIECSMDQVSVVRVRNASSSSPWLEFEFQLTKPASLHYRTADCLDDSDPWTSAESKDFKSTGVVRRCLFYSIRMSPRYTRKIDKFISRHGVKISSSSRDKILSRRRNLVVIFTCLTMK